ncbi:MAG: hypothetical protein AB8D52_05955 [Gammaproteobacteria bacterium]
MNTIFTQGAISKLKPINENYHINFDPDLFFSKKKSLTQLKSAAEKKTYVEFLARKIKRDQNLLDAHVQRIHLNYLLKNEEAYFGAVIDFFIALGSKGLSLKKSVLKPTYDLFTKEHASFIKKYLHSGILATQFIPSSESRLSKGLSSTSPVVIKKTTYKSSNK